MNGGHAEGNLSAQNPAYRWASHFLQALSIGVMEVWSPDSAALSFESMTLENHIEDVRTRIKAGQFVNEAAISQGIVLRLLQALGWPTFDTHFVCPEYALEGRRVDYALCHPVAKPVAFIEVKQIGQSGGAERQLFEYAFHLGVPLAILTDGQEWNFFLPAEQGDYGERRVYKLDLLERDVSECVARLTRYLSFAEICAGRAISAAREDYKGVARDRLMLATLPDAWRKLIEEEDDLLLELIADRVESMSGFKPDLDMVAAYLRDNQLRSAPGHVGGPATRTLAARAVPTSAGPKPTVAPLLRPPTTIGFVLGGRSYPCRNGREVLVGVFEALADRDASFLERFAARPKHGRTRRYVARSPEELYPERPDLAREHSAMLKSGWHIGTNVSKAQIERIVEMACEVALIKLGRDLIVSIGDR